MSDITPRVDIAFKKIFGVEENKDLLMSLINSVVNKEDQVVDVTILNPYNPKHFKKDKLSILDIKAEGHSGKRFNIEIQITDEADYDKRALYYWAKLYTEQLKQAQDYSNLNKTIGIHILNFLSITNNDRYHNCFHISDKVDGNNHFKDFEMHTIELNKFDTDENKELGGLVKKVKSALDIWLAFLTRNDLLNKEKLPKELESNELKKALSVLEVMNFSKEERDAYEDHLKWLRIEANTLKKAKEEGIDEGIEKGIEKVAKAMIAKNKSIEEISELTQLTKEKILELESN